MTTYETRLLTAETWDDFAALVEANNGVWGGCWCMGFHPEGLAGTPETQPEELEVTAHSESGVIMGVRHRELTVEGVQFHPESIATEHGKELLQNFLELEGGRWTA